MHGWMNEWMESHTDEWTDEWMERKGDRMNVRMSGWMEWMVDCGMDGSWAMCWRSGINGMIRTPVCSESTVKPIVVASTNAFVP